MSDEDQTVVDPTATPAPEVVEETTEGTDAPAEEGAEPTTEGTTAE